LGIGDWGLGIGDWGLGFGAQNPNPKTQNPKPKTKKNLFVFFKYKKNILIKKNFKKKKYF